MKPNTDSKTALLFYYAVLGMPILAVTFWLSLQSHPDWGWLIVPLYTAGGVVFAVFFVSSYKAINSTPWEFKVWMMLFLLDKFCLGCAISLISSPFFNSNYPYLFLLPFSLFIALSVYRRRMFKNWKGSTGR